MSANVINNSLKWLGISGIKIREQVVTIPSYIMLTLMSAVLLLEILGIVFHLNNMDFIAGILEVLAPVYLVRKLDCSRGTNN